MVALDSRFIVWISLAVSAISSFLSCTKSGFKRKECIEGGSGDGFRGFICFLPFVRHLALFGFWSICLLPFVLFWNFPGAGAGVFSLWSCLGILNSFFLRGEQPGKLISLTLHRLLFGAGVAFTDSFNVALHEGAVFLLLCCSLSCSFEYLIRRFQFKKWKALMVLSSRDQRFSSRISLYAEIDRSTSQEPIVDVQ